VNVTGVSIESPDRKTGTHEVSGNLVQQTLTEIFLSAPFRASKQSQQLLQYIVDQTLAGHGELLKERLIGVNVFGRRPDYDTNEDPIVRARAAEVRKRLAQFYVGEGIHCPVRIEISPGSYLATLTEVPKQRSTEAAIVEPPVPVPEKVEPSVQIPNPGNRELDHTVPGKTSKKRILAWASIPILLLSLALSLWLRVHQNTPIEAFWKPLLKASEPAILYSGSNAVYMLSDEFLNRYRDTHHLNPLESQGREFVVPISSDTKIGPRDLVAFKNDFITLGDLSANVRVASLLAAHGRQYDVRSGEDVAFSDLRHSPTVLIGAFNNSWTMELTGDLPFVFAEGLRIREQGDTKRVWTPAFTSEGRVAVDYAVITRMPHSKTGEALFAIAGITQSGTRAAADFITEPEQVRRLVLTAPADWATKNLQFVLQTKVVNDIPTSPVVVAFKSW
jgi:hypothetical protein